MIYSKIINPKTNRKTNINSKLGKKILQEYLKEINGSGINKDEICEYIMDKGKKIPRRKGPKGKTCYAENGNGCCSEDPWKNKCKWESGKCKTLDITNNDVLDKKYEKKKLTSKMIENLLLKYENYNIDEIRFFLQNEYSYNTKYIGLFWTEDIKQEYIKNNIEYLVYLQAKAIIDEDIKDGLYKLHIPYQTSDSILIKDDRISAGDYYNRFNGEEGDKCDIRSNGILKCLILDKNKRPVWKESTSNKRTLTNQKCGDTPWIKKCKV
tara:strand:- start:13041 stop:13841 length:801 start_codon:yes stop_codon:yes gene_type:complete